MKKNCVLYDRHCINCGECDICDLDSTKKCNNCGKCIDEAEDYRVLNIDEYLKETRMKKNALNEKKS